MDKKYQSNRSWTWQWFWNNKFVSALLVVLLVLIIIFMLEKVNFIFNPLFSLFSAVGAPIIVAGLLYYLMNPMVDWLEKRYRVNRVVTITGQFIGLLLLIGLAIIAVIPWLQNQIYSLVQHWPEYWHGISHWSDTLMKNSNFKVVNEWVKNNDQMIEHTLKSLTSGGTLHVSSVFGTMSSVIVTIITFPLILFYLLKDGHQLPGFMVKFLPKRMQSSMRATLTEINTQMSNYIRGQIAVAIAVAIMFMVGFTIVGLPYGWLLAIAAGFLNLIPFLGSFLAMVPAVIVAIFISPMMLVKILIVFSVEQLLEGKVISPKLLGDSLKIHPVTVVVILLSAGNMFGFLGVLFGIPGYAVLKVLVSKLYQWWQSESSLYEDDNLEPGKAVQLKPHSK
ncbi:AI-2E family transporter [Weissella coleopterorum]|uniref:AI-2E family transporter n=1 Tax=Weissella coleopterorum TaxID=2714949 RepID=A0A6G8B185_9LACO|nr:AI-2E family transporter [Weissella coleopterorum]QIL50975.1 AI-2E family transporter [Weissella coleopterorum]